MSSNHDSNFVGQYMYEDLNYQEDIGATATLTDSEYVNAQPSIVTQSTRVTKEEKLEKMLNDHEENMTKKFTSALEETKRNLECQETVFNKRMQEEAKENKELKAKIINLENQLKERDDELQSMKRDIAILYDNARRTNAEMMHHKAIVQDVAQNNNKLEKKVEEIQDEQISISSSYQSHSLYERFVESEERRSQHRTGSAPVAIPSRTHGSLLSITDSVIESSILLDESKNESPKTNESSSSESRSPWRRFHIRSPKK